MSPPLSTASLLVYTDGNRLFNAKPTIRLSLAYIRLPPSTCSPSARCLLGAADPVTVAAAQMACDVGIVTPRICALTVALGASSAALAGVVGGERPATRAALGSDFLSIACRFLTNS